MRIRTAHVIVGTGVSKTKSRACRRASLSTVWIDAVEVSVQRTGVGVCAVDLTGGRVGRVGGWVAGGTAVFVETLVAIVTRVSGSVGKWDWGCERTSNILCIAIRQ